MRSGDPFAGFNPVVGRLVSEMERLGLRYCHWKSNVRLCDALAGDDDIDLLIDRRDALAFQSVLDRNGFKRAVSRSGIGHPGVLHAFALDEENAKLVHVHAYSQILTGDSLVKSYRLPIEAELLQNTRYLFGIRVPEAEVELVLFAIRVALKHRQMVEILMVSRDYAVVRDELAWLTGQSDIRLAEQLWTALFPALAGKTFHELLAAIADERAVLRRVWLGRRIVRRLRRLRRMGGFAAALDRARRILALSVARLRRRKDLVLDTGGAIVALVGPKAVGKSTLGKELAARLGAHLDVKRIHVGKPKPGIGTLPLHLLVPLARTIFPGERPGEYEKPERRAAGRFSMLYVLRMTVLAHDRRRILFSALRDATAGTIVICDRYPSATPGAMDSVQFDAKAQSKADSRLKLGLMRREYKFCQDTPAATVIAQLTAPLATSIRRDAARTKQGGPDADAVQRRRTLETLSDFGRAPVVHVDTDQPIDDTIRHLMRVVWNAL